LRCWIVGSFAGAGVAAGGALLPGAGSCANATTPAASKATGKRLHFLRLIFIFHLLNWFSILELG
jgi:hypothetical protein